MWQNINSAGFFYKNYCTLRAFVTWPVLNNLMTPSLIISECIPRSRRFFSLFSTECGILPIPSKADCNAKLTYLAKGSTTGKIWQDTVHFCAKTLNYLLHSLCPAFFVQSLWHFQRITCIIKHGTDHKISVTDIWR